VLIAQNNDFTNDGGDLLWSNTANWSTGTLPTSSNTIRSSVSGSIIDAGFTVKKIQNSFGTANDVSFGGGGTATLIINPALNNGFGIENVSDSDVTLSFAGKITINNTSGITLIRNSNGNTNDANDMEFESSSTLTLSTALQTRRGSGGDIFYFNGALDGSAALRFSADTANNFGNTSNNSAFIGNFVWVGNASVLVNTLDNNIFLPSGSKLQINSTGGSVQVNGANVFQGNITLGGSNIFTVDVNKNQNSIGDIVFSADGILNLDVDNSVTALSFVNNSASSWETGKINITGFKNDVIRFGTDSNGLTSAQLSQIEGSGVSAFALNSEGYLVDANSLSIDDFEKNTINPIAYPTLASDRIYFKKLQNNVKIFDINGKVLTHNSAIDQSEISIHNLATGMYFIVFDNRKVERFLKK